jgi:hypothetical protein
MKFFVLIVAWMGTDQPPQAPYLFRTAEDCLTVQTRLQATPAFRTAHLQCQPTQVMLVGDPKP